MIGLFRTVIILWAILIGILFTTTTMIAMTYYDTHKTEPWLIACCASAIGLLITIIIWALWALGEI